MTKPRFVRVALSTSESSRIGGIALEDLVLLLRSNNEAKVTIILHIYPDFPFPYFRFHHIPSAPKTPPSTARSSGIQRGVRLLLEGWFVSFALLTVACCVFGLSFVWSGFVSSISLALCLSLSRVFLLVRLGLFPCCVFLLFPLLTGIAAVGSGFVSQGSWAATVPAMAGALATAVNAFEHGGQVGMVSEMYRNCAGFFQLLENSIQETIEEDTEERENGELFEMNVALKLGRSLSQLKEIARKSAYSRIEGSPIDEFASKLF